MSWRRGLLGVALTAAVIVAVVFGGGQWLGSVLEGRIQVGGSGGNAWQGNAEASARGAAQAAAEAAIEEARRRAEAEASAASLEGWLTGALQRTFVAPVGRDDIDLVRAEHCGDLFAVVFTEHDDVARDFYWVAGAGGTSQGGSAEVLDGAAVAAARATTTDACARLVDARPVVPIKDAVEVGAGVPDGVSLLATTLLDPSLAVAVLEGDNTDGNRQRWMGLVRLEDGHWIASPTNWIGTNIPSNDGFSAWDLTQLDPALDNQELLVGALPAGGRTVELVVGGTVYRYEADVDAPGIVIAAPEMPIDGATFRILDAGGGVVAEGSIRR